MNPFIFVNVNTCTVTESRLSGERTGRGRSEEYKGVQTTPVVFTGVDILKLIKPYASNMCSFCMPTKPPIKLSVKKKKNHL